MNDELDVRVVADNRDGSGESSATIGDRNWL